MGIFLYDSGSTTLLSDNGLQDTNPQIHDGLIVWEQNDGNDIEIMLWDGFGTTQITNNTVEDRRPQIHNNQIAWYGRWGGSDTEILFWDGGSTLQLTNNSVSEGAPQINNGQVVWTGLVNGNLELFIWDSEEVIQVTNDDRYPQNPQIDNGQVVWWAQLPYDVALWPNFNLCETPNILKAVDTAEANGPYSYLWSPGGETTQSIAATAVGTYSVNITNSYGCSDTSSSEALDPCCITSALASTQEPTSYCVIDDVVLRVDINGSQGPYSYLWSPNGETTQTITATTSGTFSCLVTDLKGHCNNSVSSNSIMVYGATASITEGSCSGQDTTLTAVPSGGVAPFSYLWSPGGETSATISPCGNGFNVYTVSITDAGICSNTAPLFTVQNCGCTTISPPFLEINSISILNKVDAFEVSEIPDAQTYNLYEGSYGAWYAPDNTGCFLSGTPLAGKVPLTFTMAAGSRWYLASSSTTGGESDSLGRDSSGTERDDGSSLWRCGANP